MSGNSQKNSFKKVISFQINLIQKNIDTYLIKETTSCLHLNKFFLLLRLVLKLNLEIGLNKK